MIQGNPDAKRSRSGKYLKGSTGNFEGRPPGTKNLHTIIREILDEMVPVQQGGRRKRISTKEAVVRSLIRKALTPPGDRLAMINVIELLAQVEEAALKAREPEYPFTEADRQVVSEIHARMKACKDPGSS